MGLMRDMKTRIDKARKIVSHSVSRARELIYCLGFGIGSTGVENILKPTSSIPTMVRSHIP